MANGKVVTNDHIFNLINSTRLELKGDINSLQGKIDLLESGRLTNLENEVNNIRVRQAVTGTKLAVLIGSITFIVTIILNILGRQIWK